MDTTDRADAIAALRALEDLANNELLVFRLEHADGAGPFHSHVSSKAPYIGHLLSPHDPPMDQASHIPCQDRQDYRDQIRVRYDRGWKHAWSTAELMSSAPERGKMTEIHEAGYRVSVLRIPDASRNAMVFPDGQVLYNAELAIQIDWIGIKQVRKYDRDYL